MPRYNPTSASLSLIGVDLAKQLLPDGSCRERSTDNIRRLVSTGLRQGMGGLQKSIALLILHSVHGRMRRSKQFFCGFVTLHELIRN